MTLLYCLRGPVHALAALAMVASGGVLAHPTPATQVAQSASPGPVDATAAPAEPSALDSRLFYQLLVGELTAGAGEPAAGIALMLDAARRTGDGALYKRAADLALQARSGDAALQAASAWKAAQPQSRDANRYVLQILVALNRVGETAEPLAREFTLTPQPAKVAAYAGIPLLYARASDKKLAARVVEQALAPDLAEPATSAAAWVTVGRMRLAAADLDGALDAARTARQRDPNSDGPALLALELMESKSLAAEAVVTAYLEGPTASPDVRMAYARTLIDLQRLDDATLEIGQITRNKPDFADAWLIQGTLQAQAQQNTAAQASVQRYLDLAAAQREGAAQSRGVAQAYLLMAQLAERRKDYAGAEGWLNRIDNAQDLAAAQSRRASLLARQGRISEARQLLSALPERTPADARLKLSAQVQLLRDNKLFLPAYELLAEGLLRTPDDVDLLYDQAMVADKLGRPDEMERLLRRAMALRPESPHAYNALGYSLAERGVRLPEARELIQKALEFAPGDPYIFDSLGWVEFKLGNREAALRILDAAYKTKPHAEIAAHLGEVLWTLGQSRRAIAIWKEGLLLDADDETLRETLQRLKVKP